MLERVTQFALNAGGSYVENVYLPLIEKHDQIIIYIVIDVFNA